MVSDFRSPRAFPTTYQELQNELGTNACYQAQLTAAVVWLAYARYRRKKRLQTK